MLMMASRRSASHHWPTVQSIDATRIDTFFDPYQVQVDTQRGTHARSGRRWILPPMASYKDTIARSRAVDCPTFDQVQTAARARRELDFGLDFPSPMHTWIFISRSVIPLGSSLESNAQDT